MVTDLMQLLLGERHRVVAVLHRGKLEVILMLLKRIVSVSLNGFEIKA